MPARKKKTSPKKKPAKASVASLKEYQAKRNFAVSPEPSGAAPAKSPKGRELFFCVQKHWASHLHYDFRLEWNGVLLSWAVPKGPSLQPRDKRLAMKVEDHPFDYGEFEGVIPEGYGAGVVMLWDKGTWHAESEDTAAALAKGELKFTLNGVKLKGSWVLVRTGPTDSRTWLLIKHRDAWSGDVDIATFAPNSVKSDGSFKAILTAHAPEFWNSNRNQEKVPGAQLQKVIEKILAEDLPKTAATSRSQARTRKPRGSTRAKSAAPIHP